MELIEKYNKLVSKVFKKEELNLLESLTSQMSDEYLLIFKEQMLSVNFVDKVKYDDGLDLIFRKKSFFRVVKKDCSPISWMDKDSEVKIASLNSQNVKGIRATFWYVGGIPFGFEVRGSNKLSNDMSWTAKILVEQFKKINVS